MTVFATIEELEGFTGLAIGETSDDDYTTAQANTVLERASREAETLCNTKFEPTTVDDWEYHGRVEEYDYDNYILLDKFPLVSTSSITIQLADEESASPTWSELSTSHYLFDGDRSVKILSSSNLSIAEGVRTIRVKDYQYGVLDKYWQVNKLVLILATLEMMRSPKGKNAFLGRAEFTTQSAGEISSPEVLFRSYIMDLEEMKKEQLKKIGIAGDYSFI